jgi:hypothetical protein
MNSDPASLENLKDIVVPPAVSWWPPAIGWWLLSGVFIVAATIFAIRAFLKWKASAYRRSALAELQSAVTDAGIAEILKRTALVAYPRVDVASLSGDPWCQWLGETSGIPVTNSVRQALTAEIFRESDAPHHDQLREFAARWIVAHKNQAAHQVGTTS